MMNIKRIRLKTSFLLLMFLTLSQFVGCNHSSTPPTLASETKPLSQEALRWVSTETPPVPLSVLELLARAQNATSEEGEDRVTVIGCVGGVTNPFGEDQPNFPWLAGQTSFFLVETTLVKNSGETGHQHAQGEECVFCALAAKENIKKVLLVQFLDTEHKPLKPSAKDFFNLTGGQKVVLTGTTKKIGETLILVAKKLYLLK